MIPLFVLLVMINGIPTTTINISQDACLNLRGVVRSLRYAQGLDPHDPKFSVECYPQGVSQ